MDKVKRLISVFLAVILLCGVIPPAPVNAARGSVLKKGDYIYFGKIYGRDILWRVIDFDKDGDPLLFSAKIIRLTKFGGYGSNWEDSYIRNWLNEIPVICNPDEDDDHHDYDDFFDHDNGDITVKYKSNFDKTSKYVNPFLSGFDSTDISKIKETTNRSLVKERDTSKVEGGSEGFQVEIPGFTDDLPGKYDSAYYTTTKDKVFLLNLKQVYKLSKDLTEFPEFYRGIPTQEARDNIEQKTVSSVYSAILPYWTRDSDKYGNIIFIENRPVNGTVSDVFPMNPNTEYGIRPAMYLIKSEVQFISGNGSASSPYIIGSNDNDDGFERIWIDSRFNKAGYFSDGMLNVQDSKTLKWGFVDKTGKLVIEAKYSLPTGYHAGVGLKLTGDTLVPVDQFGNEKEPTYLDHVSMFKDGAAAVSTDGMTFLIDKSGKAISKKYLMITGIEDGVGIVMGKIDGFIKVGLIDTKGNEIVPPTYSLSSFIFCDDLLVVNKDGKWGAINKTGKVVVPFLYDEVNNFYKGFAKVKADGKYGFVDTTGKQVVPPIYDKVNYMLDGVAVVNLSGKDIVIDKQGKQLFDFESFGYKYNGDYSEGLASVIKDNRIGYIDKGGKEVLPFIYNVAGQFANGYAKVGIDGKYGIIDKSGKVIIPIDYDNVGFVAKDIVRITKNSKHGYMGLNGKIIIPPETEGVGIYTDGLAPVETKEGWGFVDKQGIPAIRPSFNAVLSFTEGVSVVYQYGRVGLLVNPSYIAPKQSTITNPSKSSSIKVKPNSSSIILNGKAVSFDAYNINGNNYFKLRDLAKALNGSSREFDVTWDENNRAINLIPNKFYTIVGGELNQGDGKEKNAILSSSPVYKNGTKIQLTAYTIDGSNYFKLRDIGEALDITIDWDEATKTIKINTP